MVSLVVAGYEKQANLASCDIHDFGCSTKVNVFTYFCPKIPYFKLQTNSDYFLSEQVMNNFRNLTVANLFSININTELED